MIEMRWIFAPAGSGRGLLGGSDGQMYESVLQYRSVIDVPENIVSPTVDAYIGIRYVKGWSEWKDVPTPYAAMREAADSTRSHQGE
jgi:hypothetical protein